MAYDQSKLIKDVRMYLGGVSEDDLPENVIIYWGDHFDSPERYTGDYPYILWNTTLCCINHLKTNLITAKTVNKNTIKEKVGNVSVENTDDYGTTEDRIQAYDDLYDLYKSCPEKFGIVLPANASIVLINGVNQQEVDTYRSNKNTTSVYNPLPVTAFPKSDPRTPYRRNGRRY